MLTIELNLDVAGEMLLREEADPLGRRACLQQVQEWTASVLVLPSGIITTGRCLPFTHALTSELTAAPVHSDVWTRLKSRSR